MFTLRSYFYYRIHLQNRVRSCFFLQNIFYDYVKLQFIVNYQIRVKNIDSLLFFYNFLSFFSFFLFNIDFVSFKKFISRKYLLRIYYDLYSQDFFFFSIFFFFVRVEVSFFLNSNHLSDAIVQDRLYPFVTHISDKCNVEENEITCAPN